MIILLLWAYDFVISIVSVDYSPFVPIVKNTKFQRNLRDPSLSMKLTFHNNCLGLNKTTIVYLRERNIHKKRHFTCDLALKIES